MQLNHACNFAEVGLLPSKFQLFRKYLTNFISLCLAEVPLVNQQKCVEAYESFGGITPRMICAGFEKQGGKDACQGNFELINSIIIDRTIIQMNDFFREQR